MNIGSHGGSWLALALLLFTTRGLVSAAALARGLPGDFCRRLFWCMEPPFDKLDGVNATISGYTGGTKGKSDLRRSLQRQNRPCRSCTDHVRSAKDL
jgi:hypothetical protein